MCPQFDILWEDMTSEEHLLFYARIKGVSPENELEFVERALKEVKLLEIKDTLIRELPLGMRRRLSIAIALVSNPKIIFLDEPSTGLDPETRRQLWNILQDCKKDNNRAMVLTTHSMEEADVLCNRIGIVNQGVMKCLGTQNRLKNLYGGGYHLFINTERTQNKGSPDKGDPSKSVREYIGGILPEAQLLRQFNGQIVYKVPYKNFDAEKFFI